MLGALRELILSEQAQKEGFEDITVEVDKLASYKMVQFKGRSLLCGVKPG